MNSLKFSLKKQILDIQSIQHTLLVFSTNCLLRNNRIEMDRLGLQWRELTRPTNKQDKPLFQSEVIN